MPSPFPGMDPWLEAAPYFGGLQCRMVYLTVEALQPQLNAAGYYLDLNERTRHETQGWTIFRGKAVSASTAAGGHPRSGTTDSGLKLPPAETIVSTASAVLVADEPVVIERLDDEIRETFVEIFDADGHRLVTGIELVSPANKVAGDGRRQYQQKQRELRDAGVSLVEVDLLRGGPFVLDVPAAVADNVRPWHYLANLARAGSSSYELYPIDLRKRLPRIRIPLKAGDADAVLDLQAVFDRSYDVGPYRLRIDYTKPPAVPLSDEDDHWADGVLKSRGLRPTA